MEFLCAKTIRRDDHSGLSFGRSDIRFGATEFDSMGSTANVSSVGEEGESGR
jgi:hypothetical protein